MKAKYGDTRTPKEEKFSILIDSSDYTRPDFSHFKGRGLKMFPEDEIERDEEWLNDKMSREVGESDEAAEGLEAMIRTTIQNHDLFHTDSFAFSGSYYDDRRNGADVVCGFPKKSPDGRDLVFTLDVSTDTLGKSAIKKFENGDQYARESAPYTGRVKYYEHGRTKTKLSDVPHFIVGIDPVKVIDSVDHYHFENGSESRDEDPEFDEKILLEMLLQCDLAKRALANVPQSKRDQRTEKAFKSFDTIHGQVTKELCMRFGIELSPETSREFNQIVLEKLNAYGEQDRTFYHICREAFDRRKREIKIATDRREQHRKMEELRKHRAAQAAIRAQKNITDKSA